ncbi:MAG: CopG family transcriptional regulator [Candidatus Aenigmarchaeota archaeon]|nr:CopG family transcriptional regulator [Candidatus Aenigmarchaeota archaeon]
MERVKRVQVTFSPSQWKLIEKLKGKMGNTDSQVIRNIVLSWLSEKSIISTVVKKSMGEEK